MTPFRQQRHLQGLGQTICMAEPFIRVTLLNYQGTFEDMSKEVVLKLSSMCYISYHNKHILNP